MQVVLPTLTVQKALVVGGARIAVDGRCGDETLRAFCAGAGSPCAYQVSASCGGSGVVLTGETAAVQTAVGVIQAQAAQYREPVRRGTRTFPSGTLPELETPAVSSTNWSVIGTALLILGVVGALYYVTKD